MRTDTPRFIASQSILWLHADGTETMIEARIGEPYQVDGRTWACPAALEGVDGVIRIFSETVRCRHCLSRWD